LNAATQLYRDAITAYDEIALTMPQVDIPVTHKIHGGMYARQITIPAGVAITGQIYKYDHMEFMVSGDATVGSETGAVRLTGYNQLSGHSGKKRAIVAHADTIWLTIHPTDGVDGDEIQKNITAENFDELERFYLGDIS